MPKRQFVLMLEKEELDELNAYSKAKGFPDAKSFVYYAIETYKKRNRLGVEEQAKHDALVASASA